MLSVFWLRQRSTSSLARSTSSFVDAAFSVLVETALGRLLVTAHGVPVTIDGWRMNGWMDGRMDDGGWLEDNRWVDE